MRLFKVGVVASVGLTLLAVLPLAVRAKTPGGPVNTGLWVQTKPPEFSTSVTVRTEAWNESLSLGASDDEPQTPPPQPAASESVTASCSTTGASAEGIGNVSLTTNPPGQAVMQSAFIIGDVAGITTSPDYYCGGLVENLTFGTSTVQGTLSTAATSVLGQIRADIVWGASIIGTGPNPVSIDRNVDILMSFGGNQLAIYVSTA